MQATAIPTRPLATAPRREYAARNILPASDASQTVLLLFHEAPRPTSSAREFVRPPHDLPTHARLEPHRGHGTDYAFPRMPVWQPSSDWQRRQAVYCCISPNEPLSENTAASRQ